MALSDERLVAEVSALERAIDRELWIVTATDGPHLGGLLATSVSMASIVPTMPRVQVGIAKQHRTWDLIEVSRSFALHLLDEEHLDWGLRFGLQSSRTFDKFAGLDWYPGETGSPILAGAAGWLDCRVEARFETGDRTIYLAEVVDAKAPKPQRMVTAQSWYSRLPADIQKRLGDLRRHDAAADAEAIRDWRESRETA